MSQAITATINPATVIVNNHCRLQAPPQDAPGPTQPANTHALVEHLMKFFVASFLKRRGTAHA
jgi:hypothetical protein